MHCHTTWGQWAVELLLCTVILLQGRRQMAAQLLQCTASVAGGSGQCNFCNALPHYPGAMSSGTPAIYCLTAWEQWAVGLLQYAASLPGGSGQCNSCNALPHRLGVVGS